MPDAPLGDPNIGSQALRSPIALAGLVLLLVAIVVGAGIGGAALLRSTSVKQAAVMSPSDAVTSAVPPTAKPTTVVAPTGSSTRDAYPLVDQALVAELMAKLAANPNDTETLLALADEYYAGQQFAEAGTFLDKLLAFEPENIQALLARGATYFNVSDLANAEKTWQKVVEIDPKNIEVHYDLGFLYLNQPTPDWTGVQREWNMVIELDPTSDLAKTVQSHLDDLAASSLLP